MRKIVLTIVLGMFAFPVYAQFLDVNRISRPRASRSIMFQEPVAEKTETIKQEKKVVKSVPKKNAEVKNISLFDDGDVKIMAIVNGDAISSADIDSYAKIFMMNTGVPLNHKTKPMIINKVMQMAIDEKIKRQEAEKNNMKLSDKDLSLALTHYEQSRKLKKGSLNKIFKQKKINPAVFEDQLKTEILWARLVRRKMMAETHITQREVEDAIMRSKEDMKSPKYMVSEIVIPESKAKNIDVLVENIRRDKLFNMYAAQFSHSPSSASGGSLGWLKEGQLPEVLENKIKNMKVGHVSQPIKYSGNYYILKLDDKFIPSKKMKEISFADMKNVLETEKLEGYSTKYLQNLRQKSVIELKS